MPIEEVADGAAEAVAMAADAASSSTVDALDAAETDAGLDATETDVAFMQLAIAEAEAAGAAGDVPIGAIVVRDGVIIGRGRNRREVDSDPTGHAEIVALREAASAAGSWRLIGATVYATLEPCPMCAGALVNARVARVVYACPDPKAGAIDTLFEIGKDLRLNHRFDVRAGVLSAECASLLKRFFAARRPSKSLAAR